MHKTTVKMKGMDSAACVNESVPVLHALFFGIFCNFCKNIWHFFLDSAYFL